MKTMQKQLNQAKFSQKLLTFCLNYAKLISEYIGIVVYFAGLEVTNTPDRAVAQQNKKQKQPQTAKISGLITNQLNAGLEARSGASVLLATLADQLNSIIHFVTFCFLSKRFFVENILTRFGIRSSLYQLKNKNKNNNSNDSRLLSVTRHLARNRSQQNHADSLGRRGFDSQSEPRQPWLALLYQRTSRRNSSLSSGDRLLSQRTRRIFIPSKLKRNGSIRIEPRVILLSFFISHFATYVLAETKNYFSNPLDRLTSVLIFSPRLVITS